MILPVILFIYSFLVNSCLSLDERYINNILDEVYSKDNNEKGRILMDNLWQDVSDFIPESVEIPKFRQNIGVKNGFIIADKTNIWLKISKILNFNCETSEDMNICAIETELHFSKPVSIELSKEDSSEIKSTATKVSFSFEGHNTAKYWVRIPDFSQARDKISPECVIYTESFAIENLSEPTIDDSKQTTTDATQLVNLYWDSVKEGDFEIMLRIGIMKALLDKMQPDISLSNSKEISWICPGNRFEESLNKLVRDHQFRDEDDVDKDTSTKAKKSTFPRKTDINEITYEKIDYSGYLKSIQSGIESAITSLISKPEREVLMTDVMTIETNTLSSDSSQDLSGSDSEYIFFSFLTFAPIAFKHFRMFFGITEESFMDTFCRKPLTELANPAKSGSGFYLSNNKYFIAKTVRVGESDFLRTKFLRGYLLNMYQNPDTLLPKFYGLYLYKQSSLLYSNDICLLIMNNILPSNLKIDRKYDLKGSKFERELTSDELKKPNPTYKDTDFKNHFKGGIFLKVDDYKRLMRTIRRDCLVFESLEIVDYSLLLGVHYDKGFKEEVNDPSGNENSFSCVSNEKPTSNVQNDDEYKHNNFGNGIDAWTAQGEKLTLYMGMIDILQSYELKKKIEYFWKSMKRDESDLTIIHPTKYAIRFEDFMFERFKMMRPCKKGAPSPQNKPEEFIEGKKEVENERNQLRSSMDEVLLKGNVSKEEHGEAT